MGQIPCPKSAKELLDLYFIENRARLLEIAAFLDRIDRADGSEETKKDFRYLAFVRSFESLLAKDVNRTREIQLMFSDRSSEPIGSAVGLKAFGAWEGGVREGN